MSHVRIFSSLSFVAQDMCVWGRMCVYKEVEQTVLMYSEKMNLYTCVFLNIVMDVKF